MSALCSGEDSRQRWWRELDSGGCSHLHALATQELDAGPPLGSAGPVVPQQWRGTHLHWMKEEAHLAWLPGLVAVPLTLLPQATGATICNPGSVDDTQTSSLLAAALAGKETLACRAPHCPVRLESKGFPCKAPGFPRSPNHRRPIALFRCLPCSGLGDSGSELRGAHRFRLERIPKLQAEVPDPLRDHLPAFLSPGGVTAPSVKIEFAVFIGKQRLESAPMQVQLDDIRGSERRLRHIGEEEF